MAIYQAKNEPLDAPPTSAMLAMASPAAASASMMCPDCGRACSRPGLQCLRLNDDLTDLVIAGARTGEDRTPFACTLELRSLLA